MTTEQEYMSTGEAGRELGVSSTYVRRLCTLGRVKGAVCAENGWWRIPRPIEVLTELEAQSGQTYVMTAAQAGKILGLTRQRMGQLCQAGRIRGARKVGARWVVPAPPEVIANGRGG